jgi:hypothetical protein
MMCNESGCANFVQNQCLAGSCAKVVQNARRQTSYAAPGRAFAGFRGSRRRTASYTPLLESQEKFHVYSYDRQGNISAAAKPYGFS